jgi:hypothetical protein
VRLEDLGAVSLGKLRVSVALCQCGSVAGVAGVAFQGQKPAIGLRERSIQTKRQVVDEGVDVYCLQRRPRGGAPEPNCVVG